MGFSFFTGKVYIFHDSVHEGTDDSDIIRGWHDQGEKFYGYGGKDKLYGGGGDDELIGGKDNNELYGSLGRDKYVFSNGDGIDKIIDHGGSDTIQFLQDFENNSYTFERSGNHLIICYGNDLQHLTDQITIEDHFSGKALEYISFSDNAAIALFNNKEVQHTSMLELQAGSINQVNSEEGLWIDFAKRLAHITHENSDVNMDLQTERILEGIRHVATAKSDLTLGYKRHNYDRDLNDILVDGGGENSTYRFIGGDGHDEIYDWGGLDTIKISDAPDGSAKISLYKDFNDLIIRYNSSNHCARDSIRIHSHFEAG